MFAQRRLAASLAQVKSNASSCSIRKMFSTAIHDTDVCIVSAARTPLGSFNGSLASFSAVALGSHAIKAALARSGIASTNVDEVIMGNVISSNLGQAPARQAALGADLPQSVICTTVNKVCSSGLKTVMMAANEIKLGNADVIVAGGMESMTNIPYYSANLRSGARLGDVTMADGLMKDGLTDAYGKFPMGNCAEVCATDMKINREMQDDYAKESYTRAQKAVNEGKFVEEIAPVEIVTKKGTIVIDKDEEPFKVDFSKMGSLRPVFKNPIDASAPTTVTAANSSIISDGAAALVVVSGAYAKKQGLKVRARILATADHEQEPNWFTTAPSKAIPKALKKANIDIADVAKFEINEAFSVVALANKQLLNIPAEKINIYGGAVSLGHPLGASGARILVTLLSALKQDTAKGRKIGVAGICNGGGGASAVVVESFE